MATKRLGRGLDALLVDVPNVLGFSTESFLQLQQERIQLLQEAQQLKTLLDTFEQLVLQLETLSNTSSPSSMEI